MKSKNKNKRWEVFSFVDSEDDEFPTTQYITNDADACYDAADCVDAVRYYYNGSGYELAETMEQFPKLVKEIGKICFKRLANMSDDDFFGAFEYLCEKRGIKVYDAYETTYEY